MYTYFQNLLLNEKNKKRIDKRIKKKRELIGHVTYLLCIYKL